METKELIAKIEALKTFAAAIEEKHDAVLTLVRPKWLENLSVAQFVEMCDTYPHDTVSPSKYPTTWLSLGGSGFRGLQLAMSCECIEAPAAKPLDHIETLRAIATQTSAAA